MLVWTEEKPSPSFSLFFILLGLSGFRLSATSPGFFGMYLHTMLVRGYWHNMLLFTRSQREHQTVFGQYWPRSNQDHDEFHKSELVLCHTHSSICCFEKLGWKPEKGPEEEKGQGWDLAAAFCYLRYFSEVHSQVERLLTRGAGREAHCLDGMLSIHPWRCSKHSWASSWVT